MNEVIEQVTEAPAAPVKPKRKYQRKAKTGADTPKPVNIFAGITATSCPTGCTAERCVISTTSVCKHPYKSADNGCGPITLANRDKARKILKRQAIDKG